MNLGEYIASLILEEINPRTIAVFPGAFKPPHKGHLEAVKIALSKADEIIILISPKDRSGVQVGQSLKIWDLYLKLLGADASRVKIQVAKTPTPVRDFYDMVKEFPNTKFLAVFGKDDMDRFKSLSNKEKYNNVKILDTGNFNSISATKLRAAIKNNDIGEISTLIPKEINPQEIIDLIPANTIAEEINEELIPGGLAQGKSIEDIAKHHIDKGNFRGGIRRLIIGLKNQLEKGIKVELEHTTDEKIAREIAMDHLWEDPEYYNKLATIEKEQLDEMSNKEIKFWALYYDFFKALNNDNFKEKYKELKSTLDGEKLEALNYFYKLVTDADSSKNLLENKNKLNKFILYLNEILEYCMSDLGVPKPKLNIINEEAYTQEHKSYGGYKPGKKEIDLVIKNRTCSDAGRTLAHEIRHFKQDLDGVLNEKSGEDGSEHENECNSYSGKIMRLFNRKYPEILTLKND